MKLVTIIPFLKTLQKETLTYYSAKDIKVGDVVKAPVRKKEVSGLVVNVENLSEQKGDIKEADFNLRKITEVLGESIFLPSFLKTTEDVKDYFVASTGQILNTLLPKILFENYESLAKVVKKEIADTAPARENFAFQSPKEDRLVIYKTFIRESFAKKESVFFCFPTISDAKLFHQNLSKGIEKYSFFLSSSAPKKNFIKKWEKITLEDHPIVMFGTPSFFFVPRNDIKNIIIENESSDSYISAQKPYLDARIFAERFAKNQNAKIIYADSILRTETIWRVKEGDVSTPSSKLAEFQSLNWRLPEKEEEIIIDMSEEKDANFKIVSKEVFEKTQNALDRNENVLLFVSRAGVASTTVCNDCGKTVSQNGENLLLFEDRETGQRFFRGKDSRKIYDAKILCDNCQSWNLVPLGVGTDKVFEEVSKIWPEDKIIILDKISANSEKKAKKIAEEFENSKGKILIGTEMSLRHLEKPIDNIFIVSIDTLFNIPSWNIHEKIARLLTAISSKTKNSVIIQTRYKDEEILQNIRERNLIKFYKNDIENRKKFIYPPFGNVIKVSYESSVKEYKEVKKYLSETYSDWNPIIKESLVGGGKVGITMILKIKRDAWSSYTLKLQKDLLENLKILPSYWEIKINPSSLF